MFILYWMCSPRLLFSALLVRSVGSSTWCMSQRLDHFCVGRTVCFFGEETIRNTAYATAK